MISYVSNQLWPETVLNVDLVFKLVVKVKWEEALKICKIIKCFNSGLLHFEVFFGVILKNSDIGAQRGRYLF
jgi:hypothetical protein